MTSSLQVFLEGPLQSPAIVAEIRRRHVKLNRKFKRISNCRVAVSMVSGRASHAAECLVSITVQLPGSDAVVRHRYSTGGTQKDIDKAISGAFTAISRGVREATRRKSDTKRQRRLARRAGSAASPNP